MRYYCKSSSGNQQAMQRLSWVAMYIAIVCCGSLSAQQAAAADLVADVAISKVTVYQVGAMITRSGNVAIPSGNHRIVFSGLPANADPSLIRVTVNSKSVKLGSVAIEKTTQADYVATQERQLRREIEKLQDEKSSIDDTIRTAEAQLRVLDTVTFGPSRDGAKSSVDIQSLQGVMTTIGTSDSGARTRVREANIRKRDLDRNIAKLNEDLKKVSTARKDSLSVRATIDASTAVNAPVSIVYSIGDAGWQWNYEAHLDSTAKRVALIKQAQVRQGSGEDWNEVELTLTTSTPSRNNALAPLASLLIKTEEPGTYHGRGGVSGAVQNVELEEVIVTAQKRTSRFARREAEPDVEPGSYIEMDTNTTEFLAEYLVPGHVSIAATREPRMFPVNEDQFAVELIARAIPKRERQAYLEAVFKYERNAPLQAGELQLFRDDAFIGKASIYTFLPGADVRLPFGIDERIRIVVRQEPEQSGKHGMFGRQKLKDERLRFEISNYHSYPIRVDVLDRMAVAKSGDIHVDIPSGGTPPTQRDYENKPGLLLWSLNLEPRQTTTVKHYVAISYPSDKQLAGYEADE